jgi:hypothetical protein
MTPWPSSSPSDWRLALDGAADSTRNSHPGGGARIPAGRYSFQRFRAEYGMASRHRLLKYTHTLVG